MLMSSDCMLMSSDCMLPIEEKVPRPLRLPRLPRSHRSTLRPDRPLADPVPSSRRRTIGVRSTLARAAGRCRSPRARRPPPQGVVETRAVQRMERGRNTSRRSTWRVSHSSQGRPRGKARRPTRQRSCARWRRAFRRQWCERTGRFDGMHQGSRDEVDGAAAAQSERTGGATVSSACAT